MQISTRTRYGVRLLMELSLHYNEGYIQLSEISKAQGISLKYLEQIIRILRTGGLVLSQRGAQGGYILSRRPEQITMKEVIEKLEGSLELVPCHKKEDCKRLSVCAASLFWHKLSGSISSTLSSTTLADLAEETRTLNHKVNYAI